jgi:hypothetical protein
MTFGEDCDFMSSSLDLSKSSWTLTKLGLISLMLPGRCGMTLAQLPATQVSDAAHMWSMDHYL